MSEGVKIILVCNLPSLAGLIQKVMEVKPYRSFFVMPQAMPINETITPNRSGVISLIPAHHAHSPGT